MEGGAWWATVQGSLCGFPIPWTSLQSRVLYVVSLYPGPLSVITLISQQGSFCSALLSPTLDGEHLEGKEDV